MRIDFLIILLIWYKIRFQFVFCVFLGSMLAVRPCGTCKSSRKRHGARKIAVC